MWILCHLDECFRHSSDWELHHACWSRGGQIELGRHLYEAESSIRDGCYNPRRQNDSIQSLVYRFPLGFYGNGGHGACSPSCLVDCDNVSLQFSRMGRPFCFQELLWNGSGVRRHAGDGTSSTLPPILAAAHWFIDGYSGFP